MQKNILAPGLIDPHMHIESSMMTGCAYAEAALLNGTTTIFCTLMKLEMSVIQKVSNGCLKTVGRHHYQYF